MSLALAAATTLGGVAYADIWTPVAPLPGGREAFGAATGADGRIYVFGGGDQSSAPTTTSVYAYAPGANSWSAVAPLPAAQFQTAGAADGAGRVYVIGGGDFTVPGYFTARVFSYNPATNRWAPRESMPGPRDLLAAVGGSDGRIYALGGRGPFDVIVHTAERYSPAGGHWKPLPSMPTARYGLMAAAAPDGRIFAIGGCAEDGTVLATVEAYNPATNTWATRRSLPNPRCLAGVATGPDGRIYVFGGINRYKETVTGALAYDPATNAWTKLANTPGIHWEGAGATAAGHVFAVAGAISWTNVERYDP